MWQSRVENEHVMRSKYGITFVFNPGLPQIDFKNPENHVDNECLVIGFLTKQTISWLLREGNISPHQHATFFRAVKAFLFGLWSICGSGALKKMSY